MSKLIVELTPEQLRHLKFTRDVGIDRGAMDYGTADDKVTMAEVDAALEAAQPGFVLTEGQVKTARIGLMLLLVDVSPSHELIVAVAELVNALAPQAAQSEAQEPRDGDCIE